MSGTAAHDVTVAEVVERADGAPTPGGRWRVHGRLCEVDLATDEARVVDEIVRRVAPYVQVSRPEDVGDAPRHEAVAVRAVGAAVDLPSGPAEDVMIRDHPAFDHFRRPGRAWRDGDDAVVLEVKNGSAFVLRPDRVDVGNPAPKGLVKSTRRFVQDLMRLGAPKVGMMIVKAAVVRVDGCSLVFMGDTGAGKTTAVGRLLERY